MSEVAPSNEGGPRLVVSRPLSVSPDEPISVEQKRHMRAPIVAQLLAPASIWRCIS